MIIPWAEFTETNSMFPTFVKGHNTIQIVPQSPTELIVGDILSIEGDKT